MTLTILFMPESAYGPTNNCIGIGDMLRRRGHRVVFAAEASWKGKLDALGFEEDLVDLAPPARRRSRTPGQFWKDFIRETAPGVPQDHARAARDGHQADLGGADRRREVLRAAAEGDHRAGPAGRDRRGQRHRLPGAADGGRAVRPDRVVQPAGGARRRTSPPVFSGLPAGDRRGWDEFRAEYDRTHREIWAAFNAWVRRAGRAAAARPGVHPRGRPEPLRLPGDRSTTPTPARWAPPGTGSTPRCARPTSDFELPAALRRAARGRALIYFSLGSLGSRRRRS